MNKKLTSSLLLLLATVIWGSAFVSQSVAMKYVGPFTFQAIRCLLAFLILMPIIFLADVAGHKKSFIAGWKNKTLWKAGSLCGIPLFLACNLQQLALVDTDAGKSGFLTAMYIIFVPLIGIFRTTVYITSCPCCAWRRRLRYIQCRWRYSCFIHFYKQRNGNLHTALFEFRTWQK